jgi:pSer/pThr/pTyr-binding forkhead associated (FHA) protein
MLGRDPSCDLVEQDRKVSSRHANLTLSGDHALSVTDLGSTNGTFLVGGGRRERLKQATVSGGDRIAFGPSCEYAVADLLVRIARLQEAKAPTPDPAPKRPVRCRRCGAAKERGRSCPVCSQETKGRG